LAGRNDHRLRTLNARGKPRRQLSRDLQALLQLVTKRKFIVVPRLTVKQAAAYIPCGVGTLNKLRVIGGGPRYTKPAGRVLYDTRDLDQWIEASARSSTSDSGPTPRKKAA
jgi:hypothetical protein